jgi:isopentenyl-diphosphate delta-isomerase type 1
VSSRLAEDAEILSVVDAQDRVVGERRRDDVHRLGLCHRAVHVLVFDFLGRLFLQQRGLHKFEHPGLWDSSVAGHVDAGETYDACCLREVREEVGLQLSDIPERLFKLEASRVTGMEFCWVYRVVTDQPLEPDLAEMESGQWFTQEEVQSWVERGADQLTGVFILIWSTYCRRRLSRLRPPAGERVDY